MNSTSAVAVMAQAMLPVSIGIPHTSVNLQGTYREDDGGVGLGYCDQTGARRFPARYNGCFASVTKTDVV
ncbi:hypothetical protein GCM10009761_04730 [Agromyces terreus]